MHFAYTILAAAAITAADEPTARHMSLPFSALTPVGEREWVSSVLDAGTEWDELVLSWEASAPGGATLRFEAQAVYPDRETKFFTLGLWSEDRGLGTRLSVKDQKDPDGNVLTDILSLKRPARRVIVRVRDESPANAPKPELRWLHLSFTAGAPPIRDLEPTFRTTLTVPERAQMNYPNGGVICSPTALTMVINYWGKLVGRAEWDIDVPVTVEGVFDANWPGTGNWPFNTAFAASLGLRARVAQLGGIADLEAWLRAGVPVITSIDYPLLKGDPTSSGGGHLVVLIGFDEAGDPVFNDPGRSVVRRTYKRSDFLASWASSRNTVYLVHPEGHEVPGLSTSE